MNAGAAPVDGKRHSHLVPGLWFVGGLLVIVSFALPWLTYYTVNPSPHAVSLTGAEIFNSMPEIAIAAAASLALAVLGVTSWRSQDAAISGSMLYRVGHTLLSLMALVIPIEVAWRFSALSTALYGASMWYAPGIGWDLALAGAALALLGSIACWVLPSSQSTSAQPSPA